MKSITRLSLALIMFSLFSISYLVTSVTAQTAVAPTGTAPTGTPGMPPTDTAPTGTPESGGISGWIKDGLKSLGIGDGPAETTPASDSSAAPIGEGGVGGGPAAQDMSGNMINDGGHGANSGKALEAEKAKVLTKAQAINACLSFHGANDDFTKQLCGDSYNECLSDSFRQKQGAASACDKMHGSPLK